MSYPTTSFDFRDPMIPEIDPGNHFFYPTWQPNLPLQYEDTSFDHQFSTPSWATNGLSSSATVPTAASTQFPQTLSSNYLQQPPPELPNSLNIIPSSNTFGIKTIEPLQQQQQQQQNLQQQQPPSTISATTITFQQQQQQPSREIIIPQQQQQLTHIQLTQPPLPGTKLFSCHRCGKEYCRKSTLKAHLKHHMGERPFVCQICGKTFSQAANLTAHRRVHTGEKPFSCSICLRPFSQSSSLVTHKRTHTGERPYPCNHCDKAFTDSSTLTKHLRTHSGQKPYECPMCMMRFSQSGNLHRHLKTHRNGSDPDIKQQQH